MAMTSMPVEFVAQDNFYRKSCESNASLNMLREGRIPRWVSRKYAIVDPNGFGKSFSTVALSPP
ncbi:hypothetical protein QJS10_CPA03g01612 [Acorus calamus]|uniref:Uncharacterized protein n=1 Tax=Acorus calamus TaxID=4465 RepID=A0AAV9F8F6_ACOCL|nr:hypothetical protein QJS10_CPA03g01612 [Acorus calamus]